MTNHELMGILLAMNHYHFCTNKPSSSKLTSIDICIHTIPIWVAWGFICFFYHINVVFWRSRIYSLKTAFWEKNKKATCGYAYFIHIPVKFLYLIIGTRSFIGTCTKKCVLMVTHCVIIAHHGTEGPAKLSSYVHFPWSCFISMPHTM